MNFVHTKLFFTAKMKDTVGDNIYVSQSRMGPTIHLEQPDDQSNYGISLSQEGAAQLLPYLQRFVTSGNMLSDAEVGKLLRTQEQVVEYTAAHSSEEEAAPARGNDESGSDWAEADEPPKDGSHSAGSSDGEECDEESDHTKPSKRKSHSVAKKRKRATAKKGKK